MVAAWIYGLAVMVIINELYHKDISLIFKEFISISLISLGVVAVWELMDTIHEQLSFCNPRFVVVIVFVLGVLNVSTVTQLLF